MAGLHTQLRLKALSFIHASQYYVLYYLQIQTIHNHKDNNV